MEYYDYPESKIDIFTPCDRNYIFKTCDNRTDKFSYLCSFDEMFDVNKAKQFTEGFVLVVYKRYAVIQNGIVVYENTGFNDGHPPCVIGEYANTFVIIMENPRKYYNHSQKTDIISCEIKDDSDYDKVLGPKIYKTAECAVSDAVKFSGESGEKCAVVQWFDEYDRYFGLYGGLYDKYGNISGR